MEAKMEAKSVLEMVQGAILERADYEMKNILENILDVNTKADKKRTLTITIDIIPDSERRNLRMLCTAKSKLEPTNPVATSLYVNNSEAGQISVIELTPQIPGQMDLMGGEQAQPVLLRVIGGKN
jgi:hypothetical protein